MKLDLYEQSGSKKGTVEGADSLFKAPINNELMRLAVIRQLSNNRQSNAQAKGRGDVRGGGRKPWQQKHTGRARHSSIRSPIWRKGGVVFGPRNERNYTKMMPAGERRSALLSGLSQKAAENMVFALESYEVKAPKTKDFAALIKKLPVKRSVLIVLAEKDPMIEKAARNLPNAKVILVNYLNLHDLLAYEHVMFLKPALKKAEELFIK